jgi:fatty acid desaturase
MSTRKQVPPPTIDRRLLWLAALLVALVAGLVVGLLLPGVVWFLVVVLLLLAGGVVFIAWDTWQKQYKAWASRPVRTKRVKQPVEGVEQ